MKSGFKNRLAWVVLTLQKFSLNILCGLNKFLKIEDFENCSKKALLVAT